MPLQKINFLAPRIRQYVPNYLGPAVPQIFLGGPPLPLLMGGGGSSNGGVVSGITGIGSGSFDITQKAGGAEAVGKRGRGRPRLNSGLAVNNPRPKGSATKLLHKPAKSNVKIQKKGQKKA